MAYDEKFKRRVIGYKDRGHTFAEIREAFKVDSQSYYVWKQQLDETAKPDTHYRQTRKGKIGNAPKWFAHKSNQSILKSMEETSMVTKTVKLVCSHCGSERVSKNGHNASGKQAYNRENPGCKRTTFVENYTYRACKPEVRRQVLMMAVECTGIRATGRILGISKDTVASIFKNGILESAGELRIYSGTPGPRP